MDLILYLSSKILIVIDFLFFFAIYRLYKFLIGHQILGKNIENHLNSFFELYL